MNLHYKRNKITFKNLYDSPNVESFIFRFYGRILKYEYGITGKNNEKILDFGCGSGANLNFFQKLFFSCYGVDISKKNINFCKSKFGLKNVKLVDIKPKKELYFPDIKFDLCISIQTLDFIGDRDRAIVIENIYNNLKPGGFIYVSMNSYSHYYRKFSKPYKDGLSHVKFNNKRLNYNFYCTFVQNKKKLIKMFNLFKPIYVDYYDSSFRNEGSEKRYTFFGLKHK